VISLTVERCPEHKVSTGKGWHQLWEARDRGIEKLTIARVGAHQSPEYIIVVLSAQPGWIDGRCCTRFYFRIFACLTSFRVTVLNNGPRQLLLLLGAC
jgi:hypothetical protein